MDYLKRNNLSRPMKMLNGAVRLLYPSGTYCVCCGNFIDDTRSYCLCDHCIKHMRFGHVYIDFEQEAKHLGKKSLLDSARACTMYGLYERRLIFDLKYNGHTYISGIIAEIMHDRIISDESAKVLTEVDFVIPVPMFKSKEKKRGFNQAEKIATHLGKLLNVEVLSHGLTRARETAAQRSVAGLQRYDNLQGAFSVGRDYEKRIRDKKILLIDDIYTTGATANECAYVLRQSGASQVHFLALATGNDFAKGFFGKA